MIGKAREWEREQYLLTLQRKQSRFGHYQRERQIRKKEKSERAFLAKQIMGKRFLTLGELGSLISLPRKIGRSLPDLFCNMFECDRCNFWFHEICGESDKVDSEKMFCNKCKNLSSRRTIRKPKVMDL